MGFPAAGAPYAADAQSEETIPQLYVPGIIAMDRKAAGMTTGTEKPVEWKVCDQVVIKALSNWT